MQPVQENPSMNAPAGQAPAPSHTSAPSQAGTNPGQIPGILMIVMAALIVFGAFTKSWGTGRELGTGGAGLMGMEECRGPRCESASWDILEKQAEIPSDVGIFGMLGLITGLGAAVFCGVAGGLALTRKLDKLPVTPLLVVINVATFCMTFFVFRLLTTDKDIALSLSYSPFLAIGGLVAAAAITQKGLKPLVARAKA
jgi:hypothetical protein